MIDRYTKAVLTVIACCLVYGVGKDFIVSAMAQGPMDVNIVGVGGVYTAGVLPVRVR